METQSPRVRISDAWTPAVWTLAVKALGKDFRTYDQEGFGSRLASELRRHNFMGGGVAVDIGCGEGMFSESWLGILRAEGFALPEKVRLIEPNEMLLTQALSQLQRRFPSITFEPIQQKLTRANWKALIGSANLILASHVTYYFSEAELRDFLSELQHGLLAGGGLAWIIVRDRDCGLYWKRFDLLRESGVLDEDAHQFADHVLSLMRHSRCRWTTLRRHFPLSIDDLSEEEEQKVFYFLTHLEEESPGSLVFSLKDWQFSETHILASLPVELQPYTSSREEDYGDDDARYLLASTYELLARYSFIVLDLQLVRITPNSVAVIQHSPEASIIYRPKPVEGWMYRWGWQWREIEPALDLYFKKHPSFVLFDSFFSPWRSPCISRDLTKLSGRSWPEVQHAEVFTRLGPNPQDREPQPVPWDKESWEASTFDVAWVEWCTIVKRNWCAILQKEFGLCEDSQGQHKFELICFAVPARLAEVSAQSYYDPLVVETSAAVFGTVLVQVDQAQRYQLSPPLPPTSVACALEFAYRGISALTMSYVGQVIYQELSKTNQELSKANQMIKSDQHFWESAGNIGRKLAQQLKESENLASELRYLFGKREGDPLAEWAQLDEKLASLFSGSSGVWHNFSDKQVDYHGDGRQLSFLQALEESLSENGVVHQVFQLIDKDDPSGERRHALFRPWVLDVNRSSQVSLSLFLVSLWMAVKDLAPQLAEGRQIVWLGKPVSAFWENSGLKDCIQSTSLDELKTLYSVKANVTVKSVLQAIYRLLAETLVSGETQWQECWVDTTDSAIRVVIVVSPPLPGNILNAEPENRLVNDLRHAVSTIRQFLGSNWQYANVEQRDDVLTYDSGVTEAALTWSDPQGRSFQALRMTFGYARVQR